MLMKKKFHDFVYYIKESEIKQFSFIVIVYFVHVIILLVKLTSANTNVMGATLRTPAIVPKHITLAITRTTYWTE